MSTQESSKNEVHGKLKLQSAIEYITVYSAIALLIVVVIAIALTLVQSKPSSTNTPTSCYISPQLNCLQLVVAANSLQSTAIVLFTNNLGQTMHFATANAFVIYPTSMQTSYAGECLPNNAVAGAEVICNVTTVGYNPSLGTELNPRFQITYSQCQGPRCTPFTVNTVGTGHHYVSSAVSSLFNVLLLINPSGKGGTIALNGVPYPSNTYVYFVKSATYSIYANPPQGYIFSGSSHAGRSCLNRSLYSCGKRGSHK